MVWKIELAESAAKALGKIDTTAAKRIVKYLNEKVAVDPKASGESLKGNLAPLWRYRVGDYRIICDIINDSIKVIVVKIGHRRDVYR
jgi:mRNA interferase RelE/StbE